ncbi:MAG: DUF6443 domain-containing protein, partial [Anaerolineales bacterium]
MKRFWRVCLIGMLLLSSIPWPYPVDAATLTNNSTVPSEESQFQREGQTLGTQGPSLQAGNVYTGTLYLPLILQQATFPIDPTDTRRFAKSVTPDRVLPGSVVTYTFVVTAPHTGWSAVAMVDEVPEAVEVLKAGEAHYDAETHSLHWSLAGVKPGEVRRLEVQARVSAALQEPVDLHNRALLTVGEVGTQREMQIEASAMLAVGRATTALFTPEGGELSSWDGRIEVLAPPGAVRETVSVRLIQYANRTIAPGRTGAATRFRLEPDLAFDVPVTVSVDLGSLIAPAQMAEHHDLELAYLFDAERDFWKRVPEAVYDPESRTLTAPVSHFSDWSAGIATAYKWELSYNEPVVSLYSGGVAYSYPLAVPPGRNGLQPDLNLSYNSRRLDGLLSWKQEWAGSGWSIDVMDIVRDKVGLAWSDNPDWIEVGTGFNLLINGTSYALKPDGQDEGQPGRYWVQDHPEIYVELFGEGGLNETGWYWRVLLPDGKIYELGSTHDSEQVLWRTTNCLYGNCYAGPVEHRAVYRWRLHRVDDRRGNNMLLLYNEVFSHNHDTTSTLRAVYYNDYFEQGKRKWATEIRFVATPGEGPIYGWQIFGDPGRLNRIEIYQLGALQGAYRLNYATGEKPTYTRYLTSVQQVAPGGQTLPATTFDYHFLRNKPWCPSENATPFQRSTFAYPRLITLRNGYGARVEFDYEAQRDLDEWGDGCAGNFFNYRVFEKRAHDGNHPANVYTQISYTYAGPYEDRGMVEGYAETIVKRYDYSRSEVVREVHRFHTQGKWRRGREYQVTLHDGASGVLLQQTDTTWRQVPDTVASIAQIERVVTTEKSGGVETTKAVTYEYDSYGNATLVREYADRDAPLPYRTIEQEYVVNESTWIVSTPSRRRLYAGDRGGEPLTEARYYYDRNPGGSLRPWTSPPIRGELVREEAWLQETASGTGTWIGMEHWYDSAGNRVRTTDAHGYSTHTAYDTTTFRLYPIRVCREISPGTSLCGVTQYYGINDYGTCIANGYRFGAACRTYGPNGSETATRYAYDLFGRLTRVVRPGDSPALPTQIYRYHDGPGSWVGIYQREVGGQAGTLDAYTYYDGMGRAIQSRAEAADGQWVVESTVYDALGRTIRSYLPRFEADALRTAPAGPHTFAEYDALGRVVRTTNPDGTQSTVHYAGRTVTAVDANGHYRRSSSDAFGRLVQVEEYDGTYPHGTLYATTHYAYDERDNLLTVTDHQGTLTEMTYDTLGRKIAMHDPDMGDWSYAYDVAGNLIKQVDARGQAVCFAYDGASRLLGKGYAPETEDLHCTDVPLALTYSYDAFDPAVGQYGQGQRTGMDYPGGAATYRFDERGRVAEEVRTFDLVEHDYVTAYAYDSADRLLTTTYPDGEEVTQSYDGGGQPAALFNQQGVAYASGTSYNAAGQITTLALGSMQSDYTYDPLTLRLETLQTTGPGGTLLQQLSYDYDDVGNVERLEDGVLGDVQTFAYDSLDRLVTAAGTATGIPGYSQAFVYDEVGNLTEMAGAAYAYNDPAHVHAVTAVSRAEGVDRFAYDPNGNLIRRVEISGTQPTTYLQAFDAENRLEVVTNTVSGEVVRFAYDGDGARVLEANAGGVRLFVGEHYEELLPGSWSTSLFIEAPDEAVTTASTIRAVASEEGGRSALNRVAPRPELADRQLVWNEEFTSGSANGWLHSAGVGGSIMWNQNGTYLLLQSGNEPPVNYTREFPIVGRNDVFGHLSDASRYDLVLRFRHPRVKGYGTGLSVGSLVFSTNWRNYVVLPTSASAVLGIWNDQWGDGLDVTAFGTKVRDGAISPVDTDWHTVRLLVAGDQYSVWFDGTYLDSGTVTATARSVWFGHPIHIDNAGTWSNILVDYVRAHDPETNPPGSWGSVTPSTWTGDTTPGVRLSQVRDGDVGLDVSTAEYEYSTDGGSTWQGPRQAVALGASDGDNSAALHASSVPFNQASGTQNKIRFSICDLAGNCGTSGAYTIKIDDTAPTGTVSANGGAAYTNEETVQLTFTATDTANGSEPGSGVSHVRVWEGEEPDNWHMGLAPMNFTLTGEGDHQICARFRDAVGNYDLNAEPACTSIILDTTPPSGYLMINNGVDQANTRRVTVQFELTDSGSGLDGYRIWNDGADEPTGWTDYGGGEMTLEWDLHDQDGLRTVYARFRDGVENSTLLTATITLDRVPPELSITQPTEGSYLPTRTWLTVQGTKEPGARIRICLLESATCIPESDYAVMPFPFKFRTSDLVEGTNTLRAVAIDGAQNRTTVTRTFIYDPTGPSISAPAPTGAIAERRPTISASFDADGPAAIDLATLSIELVAPGGVRDITKDAVTTEKDFTYVPPAPLQEGQHGVRVEIYDEAGNYAYAGWSFVVDSSTHVAFTHPASTINRLRSSVEGLAEAGATVALEVDGEARGTTTVDTAGAFEFAGVTFNEGENMLQATATDALGNAAVATRTVTVDLETVWGDVRADPSTFTPGGALGFTTFALTATAPLSGALEGWHFAVVSGSQVITQAQGSGTPPLQIIWEGRDTAGTWVEEGTYTYTLSVSSTHGSRYTSEPRQLVVDRTPPTAPAITHPTGTITSTAGLIWIEGRAEPGSWVTLRNGGAFTVTLPEPVGPTGAWGSEYPLHDGRNRIVAVADDTTGVTSPESNALIVLHGVEPPLYEVGTDPATVAAGKQVDLWARVRGRGHPDGGSPTVEAWAYPPAGDNHEMTGPQPFAPLWTWGTHWDVPDGWPSEDVIVGYRAVDRDNLVGWGEIGLSIRNVPPAPEITGPPLLVRTQPYYTADPDLYLQGVVRSQERLTVTLYANEAAFAGTRSGNWFPGMGSNWTFNLSLPSEGRYDLSAKATSDYGLTSARGPIRTVILDTRPPTVTLSALPPFTNALGLAFDWESSDMGSGVVAHALEHKVGEAWVPLVSGGANYTHTYLSLGSRRYEFRVSARDGVGNVGHSAVQYSVVDRTPPEIALRLDETSAYAHAAGSTLYYGPATGVFTVVTEVEDPLAGLAAVVFPATTSDGATHDLAGAAEAAPAHVYAFTAG